MSSFQDYPRLSPFLWFDSNAEEAADFYVSIFPNSRKLGVMRSSVDTPSTPAGAVQEPHPEILFEFSDRTRKG